MTSTYPLPFFFPFAVPFLPPVDGGPSKSSMLLALLMPVLGLLGGAVGGPEPPILLPLLTLRLMPGGTKFDSL